MGWFVTRRVQLCALCRGDNFAGSQTVKYLTSELLGFTNILLFEISIHH